MRRMLRRLARDERGVSAVEFALLAPIMLLLYFGVAVFCQAYMAQARAAHVAAAVADLVAQTQQMSANEAQEIFAIGDLIMRPFSANTLKQRVSSVTRVSATKYQVDWSETAGMSALKENEVDVPSDVLEVGASIIIGESEYSYTSPATPILNDIGRLIGSSSSDLAGDLTFTRKAYLNPRNGSVPCPDC